MANAQDGQSSSAFERELRDMNEALLVSSIHQHELVEQAQRTEAGLRQSEAELRGHARELDRFNRAAIARESRMIELKKEFNELARRHHEEARYPLEFEHERAANPAEQPAAEAGKEGSADAHPEESAIPLESILSTEELARRPRRAPNYETECRALGSLVQALATSPGAILRVLAEKILEVLKADSAGISLLTQDKKRLYWPAIAGVWQSHMGGGDATGFRTVRGRA